MPLPIRFTGRIETSKKSSERIWMVQMSGGVIESSNETPKVSFDPFNDQLELRAERDNKGSGRTYTVTVTATETVGSLSEDAEAVVTVPLKKR